MQTTSLLNLGTELKKNISCSATHRLSSGVCTEHDTEAGIQIRAEHYVSLLHSLCHVIMADCPPTLEIKRLCSNENVQMQPNTQK